MFRPVLFPEKLDLGVVPVSNRCCAGNLAYLGGVFIESEGKSLKRLTLRRVEELPSLQENFGVGETRDTYFSHCPGEAISRLAKNRLDERPA